MHAIEKQPARARRLQAGTAQHSDFAALRVKVCRTSGLGC